MPKTDVCLGTEFSVEGGAEQDGNPFHIDGGGKKGEGMQVITGKGPNSYVKTTSTGDRHEPKRRIYTLARRGGKHGQYHQRI